MNISTVASERLTAILSTVVAIAILGAVVTAQPSSPEPKDELSRLESDLRFQIQRIVRFDGQKSATCTAQLQRTLDLWNQTEPTEANRRLFAQWLRQSMVHTMPGSELTLPKPPSFQASSQPAASELPKIVDAFQQQPAALTVELPTTVAAQDTTQRLPAKILTRHIASQNFSASKKIGNISLATTTVRINLSELTARIAGYHNGLEQIEAALLATSSPKQVELATQVKYLGSLARDYRFVRLYYESLNALERRSVIAPRPLGTTLAKVSRQFERSISGEQLALLQQQLKSIVQSVD